MKLKEKNYLEKKNRVPLSITYGRTLPNISKIKNCAKKNCNIVQINTKFHEFIQTKQVKALKRPRVYWRSYSQARKKFSKEIL